MRSKSTAAGLGRSTGWAPRSTAGAGFGILADLARGVRGSGSSSTQPESPGSHHCSRASTPSTAARDRDADQGPNARSEASTDLPRTGQPHMTGSTVWAGAGRRPWQHSMQRWTSAMLTTRPSTTALSESARHLQCSAGSPLHFRRQGGTLFRRPSAGDCRFERSPGNWASIVPRQRSNMEAVSPPIKRGSGRIGDICYHREQHE